jgi:hypothetical protein
VCRGGARLRSDTAKKFKIDPQHLLYSLQWLHFQLQLVRDPMIWLDFVTTMLLGALTHHHPQLRDRLRAARA